METLKINLRKVSSNNFDDTFRAIVRILKTSDYCRLKECCLTGGGIVVDEYLPQIEDVCYFLLKRAEKLVKLQLPVASNSCLSHVSGKDTYFSLFSKFDYGIVFIILIRFWKSFER